MCRVKITKSIQVLGTPCTIYGVLMSSLKRATTKTVPLRSVQVQLYGAALVSLSSNLIKWL
jgi:hypothetical protein